MYALDNRFLPDLGPVRLDSVGRGLRRQRVREDVSAVCLGDVIQTLQAAPEDLRAGLAVGFAAEETTELGDEQNHLLQRGWLCGWRFASGEDDQGFPLLGLEDNRTRHFRGGPPEPGEMMDPPRHHHVDGQAGFQAVGGFELAIFNAAAALEDAVEDLDPPAPGIPLDALEPRRPDRRPARWSAASNRAA